MLKSILEGQRPGDERAFIHKKILGGISKVAGILPIPGAQIVSRVTGALAGSGRTVPRSLTARPTQYSAAEKELGKRLKLSSEVPIPGFIPCVWPAQRDPVTNQCYIGDRPGRDLPGDRPIGEAIMGQYGAALVPGSMPVDRAVCLRGMVLGNDGLCYNRSQISNKQRMWPAGRRPLLSGGDMRAIGIASRAAKRLERTTKRLQAMGMIKKPAARGGSRGRGLVVKEAGAGSVTVQ